MCVYIKGRSGVQHSRFFISKMNLNTRGACEHIKYIRGALINNARTLNCARARERERRAKWIFDRDELWRGAEVAYLWRERYLFARV